MTTYTITDARTLRNLGTARTGGDIYNVNGGTLTIDQDTRYGQGGGTGFSLAAMTLSATRGGLIEVDARNVRMVPYTGGSGTITAGSTITCGGATGIVIGLYSAINVAPALTGVAAGWIKVTAWNGVAFPTSGAFTQAGFTFTINGADKVGFIELVGDEAATCTVPRLGTFRMRGEWFDVGTTSGSNATTYQLPTNGSVQYYPGVQVETSVGSGVFEWYPCAGSLVAAASTATDAVRGKVCWISTAGVLRLGSDGTNLVGYVPPAGLKIRLPNIITANCTPAARTVNALPNATLATRYDFTTTGAGVIDLEKCCLAWYPSFAQAYSLRLVDVGANEQLSISELATPINMERFCVGQSAAQAQFALNMSLCFAGGTATDCVWTSASLAASGRYVRNLTDVTGIIWTRDRSESRVLRANISTGNANLARVADCEWVDPVFSGGRQLLSTCQDIEFSDITYTDAPTGTTETASAMSVVDVGSGSQRITMDGLSFGGLTNVQSYNAPLNVAAAGCKTIKMRNIGTRAAPLSLGSTNGSAYVFSLAIGAAASDVRVQRVYCTGTRTNFYTLDNSSKDVLIENSQGDYADAPTVPGLNVRVRGVGCTSARGGQISCYGTHWLDEYNSATVGRIIIAMNEATAETADQVALSGGAAFTSAGGLYMPVIGQSATFTMPYSALGQTGFANSALVMGGGTVGNYTFAFQIDTGSGFGAWSAELTSAALGTALNALGAINPATGVRLKLRITTVTANTTQITSVYLSTTTTAVAQDNLYPLDLTTLTISANASLAGAEVRIYDMDNSPPGSLGTELAGTESNPAAGFTFTGEGGNEVWIQILQNGYREYGLAFTMPDAASTLPVILQPETNA